MLTKLNQDTLNIRTYTQKSIAHFSYSHSFFREKRSLISKYLPSQTQPAQASTTWMRLCFFSSVPWSHEQEIRLCWGQAMADNRNMVTKILDLHTCINTQAFFHADFHVYPGWNNPCVWHAIAERCSCQYTESKLHPLSITKNRKITQTQCKVASARGNWKNPHIFLWINNIH